MDAYGKHGGHRRDQRAGHVFKGETWELERTVISLLKPPEEAYRLIKQPGMGHEVSDEAHEPKGTQTTTGAGKVSGSEPKAKRPEMEKR